MIRPLDGAMIPIASVMGENDLGQNAFATMSDTKIGKLNYFTFLHGNDIMNGYDTLNKVYKMPGYNIEIYGLSNGYYGYFQRQMTYSWLSNILQKEPDMFKIAYYHNPLFPACPDHKQTVDELANKLQFLQMFSDLGIKMVFEHHEQLYKVSHPMKYNQVISEKNRNEEYTYYVGGGQWGTPNSQ